MRSLPCLASLAFIFALALGAEKRIQLENYNDWNLPFAKSLKVSPQDYKNENFPSGLYQLALNPAAFFSVFFIET